jgi:hypothetical protein
MSRRGHPYIGKPDFQFWKSASGVRDLADLDPVTRPSFRIAPDDLVVTAGSCFAQHVARHLVKAGFKHHVTETGHPLIGKTERDAFNYGVFSARYGNLYTARQLLQLLQRAYGLFTPLEQAWPAAGGAVVDPFRPQIQPKGFIHAEELAADREQHLAAVRTAIEEMDVFVFTLGLTESWRDRRDGAVYPLAPGVAGGTFDESIHEFHNFDASETAADLNEAFGMIRERNPRVRFLVTVSPVPLNATALPRHVWVSTAYSKAVLRVAAEQVCSSWDRTDYFPSYEIITSPHVRGRYYAADGREVVEAGVEHVMRVFLKHYGSADEDTQEDVQMQPPEDSHLAEMERIVRVLCDEEAISNSDRRLEAAGQAADAPQSVQNVEKNAEVRQESASVVAISSATATAAQAASPPSAPTLRHEGASPAPEEKSAQDQPAPRAWDVIHGKAAVETPAPAPEPRSRGFFGWLLGRK